MVVYRLVFLSGVHTCHFSQLYGQTVDNITYKTLRNKDFKEVTLQVMAAYVCFHLLIGRLAIDLRFFFSNILFARCLT